MEPLFEIQGVITEDLLIRMQKAHMKLTRTRMAIYYVAMAIMAVLVLIFFLLMAYSGDWLSALPSFMLLLFFFLILLLLRKSVVKSVIAASRDTIGMPYTIRFYHQEYIEYSPRGEWRTSYAMIHEVRETDDLLLIYQTKAKINILEKCGFIRGTPETLVSFLCSSGQVPYKRLQM